MRRQWSSLRLLQVPHYGSLPRQINDDPTAPARFSFFKTDPAQGGTGAPCHRHPGNGPAGGAAMRAFDIPARPR